LILLFNKKQQLRQVYQNFHGKNHKTIDNNKKPK